MSTAHVLRYAAFTADPQGGNPAGIVLDAAALSDSDMVAVAADVGYSETAFLSPGPDGTQLRSHAVDLGGVRGGVHDGGPRPAANYPRRP